MALEHVENEVSHVGGLRQRSRGHNHLVWSSPLPNLSSYHKLTHQHMHAFPLHPSIMKPHITHSPLSLTLKLVFPSIEPRDPSTYYTTTTPTTNTTSQKPTSTLHTALAITLLTAITCLLFLFFLFLFFRRSQRNRGIWGLFDRYVVNRRGEMRNGPNGGRGVDPCVIESLPVLLGLEGILENEMGSVDCAVCLSEFDQCKAVVKRIPFCGHFFHAKCIEMWLLNHSSCPLCRSEQLFPLPPKLSVVDQDSAKAIGDEKLGDVAVDVGRPSSNCSGN